ncbi:hypothetical protein LL06_19670 [Hoeflea sp. BAL378]|uniref:hypothetical protein n=1 Tax=Hoeflea sp. BAL378 TaxID=1547437 RepID=UPI000512C466|nr:hypothetical protein [Hoeflea sp. BAL378]KGF67899.1 hypothetical protein LL06_19670 [Hoeflea sp. BAL378]
MIHLANTVTKTGAESLGQVLVCGSHGGLYPGYLAAKARVKAVILNDAGGGKDAAGIGSLAYLQKRGIAAATVGHMTCRIGDAADMAARGRITHVNAIAAALGVTVGDACSAAAEKLDAAPVPPQADPGTVSEARSIHSEGARRIVLIDSASLVKPEDKDQIVVTGSHGGLLGGNDFLALQVDAFAGVFHDAGIGIDEAGATRLPALDRRGISGLTVDGATARIGDARSVLQDGVISRVNDTARALGAAAGERLIDRLMVWAVG